MELKRFKVGDKIIVKPRFYKPFSYTITRLTKTQAVAEWTTNDGRKLCERFGKEYRKLEIVGGYQYEIERKPKGDFLWDTNTYEVVES